MRCTGIRREPLLLLAAVAWLVPTIWASEPDDRKRIEALLEQGETVQAVSAARALLATAEGESGRDSVEASEALDLLVPALIASGKEAFPEALDLARRALTIKEQALGTRAPELVESLKNLGAVLDPMNRFPEAQESYARALAIQEHTLGPDHPEVADTLTAMSSIAWWMGDAAESKRLCERSVEIVERTLGPGDIHLADCLDLLMAHTANAGELQESRALAERRLAVITAHYGPDHPQVANALTTVANSFAMLGDYPQADTLFRRALAILEKSTKSEPPGAALVHFNYGALLKDSGDYGRAREEYQLALTIWRKSLPPDDPSLAIAQGGLGVLLFLMGDPAQARPLLEEALRLNEKTFGATDWRVGVDLKNLASLLAEVGEGPAARRMLERSVGIHETGEGARSNLAYSLNALARLDAREGNLVAAKAHGERALASMKEQFGPEHPYVAAMLLDLARAHEGLGDLATARRLLADARQIQEKTLGPFHPELVATVSRLAALALADGARGEALEQARRAMGIVQVQTRETVAYLPERPALLLVSGQSAVEEVLFHGLRSAGEDAGEWRAACWDWVLGRRGVVLEELAWRNRAALEGVSAEAPGTWKDLAAARRALGQLWTRGSRDQDASQYRAALTKAWQRKEEAESRLAAASAEFRRQQGLQRVTRAEVQGALPPGSALVEIVRTGQRDLALILREDGTSWHVDLGPAEKIDAVVDRWRAELETSAHALASGLTEAASRGRLEERGVEVRRATWDPVVEHLDGVTRVFLVPDGALHRLDVGALPTADGRYLVEAGPTILLLSTGRDLVRLARDRPATQTGRGLLALGAPDFDAAGNSGRATRTAAGGSSALRSTACLPAGPASWSPLPESAREVRAIASQFQGREPVETLTGNQATEERFRQDAPKKRILHLATHGFFLERGCGDASGPDNPLLHSGLVLAGANRGTTRRAKGLDDGVLTAEEIAALDLRGLELAVLSACDTGRGEIEVGEGVFGLRRAFEIAGARRVVMSLWPVPDRQARRWMDSFYTAWIEGDSIDAAARRASLERLRDLRERSLYPHPYLWSGFVSAGDWR